MLKLIDLIRLAGVNLGKFKIHLADQRTDPPIKAFLEGRFKGWQEHQSKRNFPCSQVLSLIRDPSGHWLFAGVWTVDGAPARVNDSKPWYKYSTTEVPGLEHLTGRALISFKRSFRQPYLWGTRYGQLLIVAEILPERLSIREFPGFASVLLSFPELRQIVSKNLVSWRAALASVGGIYIITDRARGRHYIGSAYGVDGIWGRWRTYAATGHGGNVELSALLGEAGTGHADNFYFSILEICDVKTPLGEVQKRESHWKAALGTRVHGYNSN